MKKARKKISTWYETPAYLRRLAKRADPDYLWRTMWLDEEKLTRDQRMQMHTGIALRRYASHIEDMNTALAEGKSLLITPLSPNGNAHKFVKTPAAHRRSVK